MNISGIITQLVQFNKTERIVYVRLCKRDSEGNVIHLRRYPVEAVFSHDEECAEIIIEESQQL